MTHHTPLAADVRVAAEIVARIRVCSACGAQDVDTQRYSFAGRCCAACLPAMRAQHERPGWCD